MAENAKGPATKAAKTPKAAKAAPAVPEGYGWNAGTITLRSEGAEATLHASRVVGIVEGGGGTAVLHLAGGGTLSTTAPYARLAGQLATYWSANRKWDAR